MKCRCRESEFSKVEGKDFGCMKKCSKRKAAQQHGRFSGKVQFLLLKGSEGMKQNEKKKMCVGDEWKRLSSE